MNNDLRWNIAMTFSGADYDANEQLLRRSIRTVFPHEHEAVRRGRWLLGRIRPRFPGYIFVAFGPGQSADELLNGRRRIFAIRNFLRDDSKQYIRVPASQIEKLIDNCVETYLRSWEPEVEPEPLKPGDWVPVPKGPFREVPCHIDAIDKSGRVEASIGPAKVSFRLSDLEAQAVQSVPRRYRTWPSTLSYD
jgi:transcriptional antiterminator RfaH